MLGRSIFIALLALALKLEAVLATVDKEAESSYIRANKRKEEATTLAHSVPETPTGRERKLKGRRSSTGSKSPSSKGPKSGKDSSKGPKSTSSKGPKSAKGLAEGSKLSEAQESIVATTEGPGQCQVLNLYYSIQELQARFEPLTGVTGKIGANVAVPLYDTFTDEVVGTFDQITFALGTKDCYFEAVYNLDVNQRGISESQIMVSGTCFGLSDAVTGGTGEYACAAGKVERRETQNGKIEFHLIDVCHGCAA